MATDKDKYEANEALFREISRAIDGRVGPRFREAEALLAQMRQNPLGEYDREWQRLHNQIPPSSVSICEDGRMVYAN